MTVLTQLHHLGKGRIHTVTSLNPDVLPELGGHANQKSVTSGRQNFMEVVATAANNLSTQTQLGH